ncbi:hypothetical protein J1N35_038964 [Gossypium stocksii]|uniref:Uncharacterized protein n=1 Tax=Gossypium stocksii TaxID=47602 RepID=A0A9D3UNG7_9ROSI|nr:hypothetical protein J1N35_038964 [Gossypium stocksii]
MPSIKIRTWLLVKWPGHCGNQFELNRQVNGTLSLIKWEALDVCWVNIGGVVNTNRNTSSAGDGTENAWNKGYKQVAVEVDCLCNTLNLNRFSVANMVVHSSVGLDRAGPPKAERGSDTTNF